MLCKNPTVTKNFKITVILCTECMKKENNKVMDL